MILLSLLATLAQNHTSVMELSRAKISQMIDNSDALPKLIFNRVQKSIQHLKDTELSIESNNKTESSLRNQKTIVEEI